MKIKYPSIFGILSVLMLLALCLVLVTPVSAANGSQELTMTMLPVASVSDSNSSLTGLSPPLLITASQVPGNLLTTGGTAALGFSVVPAPAGAVAQLDSSALLSQGSLGKPIFILAVILTALSLSAILAIMLYRSRRSTRYDATLTSSNDIGQTRVNYIQRLTTLRRLAGLLKIYKAIRPQTSQKSPD